MTSDQAKDAVSCGSTTEAEGKPPTALTHTKQPNPPSPSDNASSIKRHRGRSSIKSKKSGGKKHHRSLSLSPPMHRSHREEHAARMRKRSKSIPQRRPEGERHSPENMDVGEGNESGWTEVPFVMSMAGLPKGGVRKHRNSYVDITEREHATARQHRSLLLDIDAVAMMPPAIAICFLSGALAFRTAPATTRVCAAGGSRAQADSWHRRNRQGALMAAAEGYDEWYIDSPASEGPAADGRNDEDVRRYFATCIPGLQATLASELIGLGASHVEAQGKSGVRFEGTPKVGMKSLLWCRTAHKILELIASSCDVEDDFDSDYECSLSQGIRNREDLYQFTQSAVHTPTLLGDGSGGLLTLSVSTIYASKPPNKELCHSHYTALTVKNALVDAVRDLREDGDRPDIDIDDADVPLVLVVKGKRVDGGRRRDWRDRRGNDAYDEEKEMVAEVDLYRCLHSGGSLHRRGYRQASLDSGFDEEDDDWESNDRQHHSGDKAPIHKAAMKESLAAGLLLEAGWDKLVLAARGDGKGAVLADPMCGSGTLPTEAALIATDMAPGLCRIASWRGSGSRNPHRHPPCIRWKDFSDGGAWNELLKKATLRFRTGLKWACSSSDFVDINVKIVCNEINPRAASLARTSIDNAGVGSIVSLSEGDCADWELQDVLEGRTIFVCNPPWGLRLTEDIDKSWVSLREFLRREAGGAEAWVLSGNPNLTKILRMKKSRSVVIRTADEDLRWLQYHVFAKQKV